MTVLSLPRKLFLPFKAEIWLQEVTSAVTRLLVGQAPLLATKNPAKRHKLVTVDHLDLCSTVQPMGAVSLNYRVGRAYAGEVLHRSVSPEGGKWGAPPLFTKPKNYY